MGNRRLGKRRLDALLDRTVSSSDEWGYVRPEMNPGASTKLRVQALGPMHGYGFEDAADIPADGQATAFWLREDENSSTIALSNADADFTDGCFVLTPGNADNDKVGFMTLNQPISCTTGKKWWLETSFKIADIDDCTMFFGVIEDVYNNAVVYGEVAAGAGADKVGFKKAAEGTGVFATCASLNSAESTGTGLTVTANNDVVNLGIYWDGAGNCNFYGAFAATGTDPGAMPLLSSLRVTPDQAMGIVLEMKHATAAADDALSVNYVRAAWEK
jgi:hypothetical protein